MRLATLSLRARLLMVATCVLAVFLGLTGVVLDQAFRRSAEQGVSERLLVQIYGLLAATDEVDRELFLPEALQEPEFNRLGTGLYAVVLDSTGRELWRSTSAIDLSLTPQATVSLYANLAPGEPRFGRVETVEQRPLFFLSYRILWQGAGNTTTPYTFAVLQTLDTYLGEVSGFTNNLWLWLVGVVIALVLVQGAVMSWGLSPLRRLATDLKQIEDGHQQTLEGQYPAEIEGVTRNLNLLLASERQQREKYRTTLADLAHSLKTPLAILKGAASSVQHHSEQTGANTDPGVEALVASLDEQVARMDEIVSYQLGRAMTSGPAIIRRSVEVVPLLEGLEQAMCKVYAAREIAIQLETTECTFFGDERDLMELAGNLVDNACKYSKGRVRIEAGPVGDRGSLALIVEDDGPGIPLAQRTLVAQRGARLDSKEAGQGIGLAVVVDIVERYGGTWQIGDSTLGGVRFAVTLP